MLISYLYCLSYSEDILCNIFLIIYFVYKSFAAISKNRVNDFRLSYMENEPFYFKKPAEMLIGLKIMENC